MRKFFLVFALVFIFSSLSQKAQAQFDATPTLFIEYQPVETEPPPPPPPSSQISPVSQSSSVSVYDLIEMINRQRIVNGFGALRMDDALMACAQNTAQVMASNNMSWHIGGVAERASQFGYNNYNKAFATENFAMGNNLTAAAVENMWWDPEHQRPAIRAEYCHVGAGIAKAADGTTYYVLQAAYPAGKAGCGYLPPPKDGPPLEKRTPGAIDMSQIIKSVKVSTPMPDGVIYHVVESGQSLWSIATAYKVKIEDIAAWNKISDTAVLRLGQKLLIPTAGSSADKALIPTTEPTILPTMASDGKFRHTIKENETLSSIAKLWGTTVSELLRWNGLEENATLGVGWKLFIPVTPTLSPIPTFTMMPSLTPTITMTPLPAETVMPALTATSVPRTHLPKRSLKTYFLSVLLIGGLGAGGFFAARYYYRKN